jgi:hypothetical protein
MQDLPVLFDATWRLVKQGGWIMFAVFVLGQIAQRFFIEPIQEQRRVIGR